MAQRPVSKPVCSASDPAAAGPVRRRYKMASSARALATHAGDLRGVPTTCGQPGLATGTVAIWEVKQ